MIYRTDTVIYYSGDNGKSWESLTPTHPVTVTLGGIPPLIHEEGVSLPKNSFQITVGGQKLFADMVRLNKAIELINLCSDENGNLRKKEKEALKSLQESLKALYLGLL